MPCDVVTFEDVRERFSRIDLPSDDVERRTCWVIPKVLGLARESHGGHELFMVAGRLEPRTHLIRRHLEFGSWSSDSGATLHANRLVLPAAPHFLTMSVLIAIELAQRGFGSDNASTQKIFEEVEPIIELALRSGALSEETILGLIGELLLLERMLGAISAEPDTRASVLDMWQGYRGSTRDFLIGRAAVEVKTTSLSSSSHHIHGVDQIELNAGESTSEDRLCLFSIGLAPATTSGIRLPELVERLLQELGDKNNPTAQRTPLQLRFLEDVAKYGMGLNVGYDHDRMQRWRLYNTPYTANFTPRLYNLTDPQVKLLRRAQVEGTFARPGSVQYEADFPDEISELNPDPNWSQTVRRLVRQALGLND